MFIWTDRMAEHVSSKSYIHIIMDSNHCKFLPVLRNVVCPFRRWCKVRQLFKITHLLSYRCSTHTHSHTDERIWKKKKKRNNQEVDGIRDVCVLPNWMLLCIYSGNKRGKRHTAYRSMLHPHIVNDGKQPTTHTQCYWVHLYACMYLFYINYIYDIIVSCETCRIIGKLQHNNSQWGGL